MTTITVSSQGGNIDCSVFDHRSAVIASDNGPENSCEFRSTPLTKNKFTVLVTNVHPKEVAKITLVIQ